MQDALTNAAKIEFSISEIEKLIDEVEDVAQMKANGIANYDKAVAITILKLKQGLIKEFEGTKIESIPATVLPTIAKGICYKEAYDKEIGESIYKGLITKIEARKAQLNGYQSLNKIIQ